MKWVMPEYLRRNLDRYKYVLLVCALGLLLTLWPQGKKEETAAADGTVQDAGFSAYVADTGALEEQLADLLEQIDGVGRVQVLLTAKRGYEPAYVYNSSSRSDGGEGQTSNEEQSELVVVNRDGGEGPVIASVSGPEYQGAVIVCDGAESPQVRLELTEAVRSLTGISSDHIKISKMKGTVK